MDDRGLDFILDPTARAMVRHMLAAVVEHPDIHRNLFKYQRQRDGTYEYFLGKHGGGPAAFDQHTRLPTNVVDALLLRGWAEANREPGFGGGWYRFTDKALEWYRATSGPTDDEVRSDLGRYFQRLARPLPGGPPPFDAAAIARELGYEESRVLEQTAFLVGAGVLQDVGPGGARMPKHYALARPDGFRWAASGFGPLAELGTTTVHVHVGVTINITPLLLDVGALPIPEGRKQEVAEAAEELQREPTIEKVGKLMEFGANTATLVPALTRFFAENGPALLRFFQDLPGGVCKTGFVELMATAPDPPARLTRLADVGARRRAGRWCRVRGIDFGTEM